MRRTCVVALVLILTGAAHAADEPKPNMLTPKEIADGWLLLFDGESTFGWKAGDGVSVKDGSLKVEASDRAVAFKTTTAFHAFELRFQYSARQEEKGNETASLRLNGQDWTICTSLADKKDPWFATRIFVESDDKSHTVGLEDGRINQKPILRQGPNKFETPSRTTLDFHIPAHLAVAIRNIKLRPLGLTSLFNGKDLTGWKKYTGDEKRARSEFSVNKDGELTMKNGPGDLQTEKQWADFILQIECKTNGKHLNSGVFFRCIPDQYQNGYEAQIHNGWDKEKEYTVEEYDPKTNELKTKHKIKSTAMDYGTGAIYRRIPARKEVARDREWFTMTVVAEGRHIATWVNGIQVVDWTDNRPLKDNARNGCCLEKGPISLQGHDPTTDLNFRNIRIAELK